jgi:hypothetical protein
VSEILDTAFKDWKPVVQEMMNRVSPYKCVLCKRVRRERMQGRYCSLFSFPKTAERISIKFGIGGIYCRGCGDLIFFDLVNIRLNTNICNE